ncbi:MAG: hypothetical protein ACRENU_10080 [Gemmatimonadaceae bacterium]
MEDELFRETAPAGDAVKPPRKPPTAVGVATPANPDRSRPGPRIRARRRHWYMRLLSGTLDVLDHVGDAVAAALKLRSA